MKKLLLIIFIVFNTIISADAQAIGYQGKKFMIEVGYSPASNLSARYFSYRLNDDYYTNIDSAKDPLIFKHIPKIGIEYVIFNSGSIVIRYNPWKYTSNMEYFDNDALSYGYVGNQIKGGMLTLGYKSYITATPAPLGSYFGVFATLFNFKTTFVDSEFDENLTPQEFADFGVESGSSVGVFAVLGSKNILWDQVTLDFCLEGGVFLKNGVDQSPLISGEFGERYSLTSGSSPQYNSLSNTGTFFFVVPTISVGWLVF